jgi:hypothetical protein
VLRAAAFHYRSVSTLEFVAVPQAWDIGSRARYWAWRSAVIKQHNHLFSNLRRRLGAHPNLIVHQKRVYFTYDI